MALKLEYGDAALDVWDEWSSREGSYDRENNLYKWRTFATERVEGKQLAGIGTIVMMAKKGGYVPPTGWPWGAQDEFELLDGRPLGGGDIENGKRFAAEYRGKLLFVAKAGWRQWDGARWAEASEPEIDACAKQVSSAWLDECVEARKANPSDATKLALGLAAQTHKNLSRVRAIPQAASSEPGMFVTDPGKFDADPWLLSVPNGVVDLRTGELRAANPEILMSKQAGVAYGKDASCDLWLRTLDAIFSGDAELVDFFRQLCGYTLTGSVDEEVCVFCYGHGANGKSTVASVMTAVLGEYAGDIPPAALSSRRDSGNIADRALVTLPGRRLIWINETQSNDAFDDQRLKQLASRDNITARRLHQENFTFKPSHKLWLRGNHKPGVHDNSAAFWRRMIMLPFTRHFAPEERIPDLDRRIIATEGAGVLRWMVEGCMAWQRNGRLILPKRIEDESNAYREESDVLGEWMRERCETGPDKSTMLATAYSDYCVFLKQQGMSTPSSIAFGKQIEGRGLSKRRIPKGMVITGLALKTNCEAFAV